jgi:hypothetical protein
MPSPEPSASVAQGIPCERLVQVVRVLVPPGHAWCAAPERLTASEAFTASAKLTSRTRGNAPTGVLGISGDQLLKVRFCRHECRGIRLEPLPTRLFPRRPVLTRWLRQDMPHVCQLLLQATWRGRRLAWIAKRGLWCLRRRLVNRGGFRPSPQVRYSREQSMPIPRAVFLRLGFRGCFGVSFGCCFGILHAFILPPPGLKGLGLAAGAGRDAASGPLGSSAAAARLPWDL